MKKWTRRIFYGLWALVLGMVLLDLSLHVLSRTTWFKERVSHMLQQTLNREMKLARMGANLKGVFIEGLQIAEKEGFEKGIFAQVGRLQVRVSLLHLLRGQIKIQGITLADSHVQLAIFADGATNWQDWTSATPNEPQEQEESSKPFSLPLTVSRVRLENLQVVFTDHRVPRALELKGLNLEIKDFSFQHEFPLALWTQFYHEQPAFERGLTLILQTQVNLSQLELEKAYVKIDTLKALHEKSSLVLQGKIENLLSPRADFTLKAKNISSNLFEGLVDLPRMDLSQLEGEFAGALHAQQQTFTLDKAIIKAPGLDINSKGQVNYAGKQTRYEFAGEATGIFGEMGRWFKVLADPYRLVGTTQLDYTVTQDKITAQFDLQDMGALLPQAGRLANITGKLSGWEQMNFKAGRAQTELVGKFEGSPFTLALKFEQTPQKMLADLKAHAKELHWQLPQGSSISTQELAPSATQTQEQPSGWSLPLDLKADIDVEKLEVPYFYGTKVMFNADIQGFTPDLTKTHGMLRLRTEDGKIQDIYKLTNANPLTKVLFMSLNLTGKVFNSLNVLGVLKSVGGGIASVVTGGDKEKNQPKELKTQTVLGPDGEPLEIPLIETEQKIEGEMPYDKFDTQVDFISGKATVKEGAFVAPMMSLRLDGTTDFNTGIVNLTVHAAPGRHEVDGMMPLTLKIKGTVDEPTGNMQLLGSVASLVTQTITNNVVSRNVTKGVKGFFGLFKKKEDSSVEEQLPQEQPVQDAPTQEQQN